MGLRWQPAIRTVPAYHDHPLYIEALAQSVEAAYAGARRGGRTCWSPATTGCRSATCARAIPTIASARRRRGCCATGWASRQDEVVLTFQSRFGREEWLQPYTVEEVARLARAGKRHIAIMAPAFSADCVETLEEIEARSARPSCTRAARTSPISPASTPTPAHVDMMAAILERELAGWALTPVRPLRGSDDRAQPARRGIEAEGRRDRGDRPAAIDVAAVADQHLAVRQAARRGRPGPRRSSKPGLSDTSAVPPF